MKEKTLGHIYALFTILVWGSCFVLTKVMLTAYTPTQIIPLRMGLAYLTLWALRPKTMKLPWKDELMFILIGITGGSFYFFLQNTAAAHTSAANVSILVALSPILTVLLAQLFSRSNERLGKYVYIGAVIAIIKYCGEGSRWMKPLCFLCDLYTTVIRGIPVVVVLLIFYFVIMQSANGITVGIGELISCTFLGVALVKLIESNTALKQIF